MIITSCRTGFGWVGIAASEVGLVELILPQATEAETLRQLQERYGPGAPDDGRLATLKSSLQAYFRGEEVSFDEWALDDRAGTPFRRKVWAITRAIPRGQTRTYGELALAAGSPRAARAVGQSMARNPWPIIVPCHRVVGSNGRLTGFGGGLEMKRRLLDMEGAMI